MIVQGNGQSAIDPLIAVAPALVLALFALIAVVLAGPLAALAAALTSRSRGLIPYCRCALPPGARDGTR
ncbi:hypothetical protein [Microbacterium sp. NIBRBAC000506063]|uniref:hypothetical protein n=1 Tax=Microbacterium sp. NIBRBAC000506063 TaxID=2734618 RepID=UPI001BB4C200|nr:hypothetical protein [Microbacterium sp. NIBRBAC000506063]QTV79846.1 hypothetical protein KAE78_00990 [Microbacterium sp. NIBRBAC000506063]